MTMLRTRLAGLVAAALVAAAGLVGLSSGPAAAALCSGKGVNVVVDFHGLGGGVQKGCDPNGANKSGRTVFPAAGFQLTYAAREPGFVCRVQNAPKSDPCGNASPTNAYWGLYWSNGKSGKWTYSSSGVGGTSVPDGGFLAFSWQNGGSADPPGAAPVNSKPDPAPKPQPTKKATKAPAKQDTSQGTNQGTKQSDSGSGSTSAKAPEKTTPDQPEKTGSAAEASPQQKKKAAKTKRAEASKRAKASSSASTSASASQSAAPEASDDASPDASSAEPVGSSFAADDEQGGLPVWVPVLVIVALAGSAGGAAWWRRRTGTP